MTPLVVVVAMLVVYRLTLLVVADELTAPWRDKIVDRYVHPVHELTYRPAREPFDPARPIDRETDGYAFVAVCRCGARFVGDEWADVASEANGHTNPHVGEMTDGPRWLIMLDCPWCVSWWIAVPVSWSAWCFGDRSWWFVPAVALAASGVTGILATYAKPVAKSSR